MSGATTSQRMQSVSFLTETEKRQKARKILPKIAWRQRHQSCGRAAITREAFQKNGKGLVCDCDLFLCTFPQPCLGETEIEYHCVTKMNAVTNSQPRGFAAPKHAVKPDEDANRDVETSLYPRESCNATADNWRDWWCAGQFVPTPCLQFSPCAWNAPTQLRDEVMYASQCVFSLRKGHLQLPTTLLRTMKVPYPSPMLCRARFYQIRPKSERNSTSFVDNVPRYQCQLPNLSSCLFSVAQCVLPLIFFLFVTVTS